MPPGGCRRKRNDAHARNCNRVRNRNYNRHHTNHVIATSPLPPSPPPPRRTRFFPMTTNTHPGDRQAAT
ncbi:MAG: hypothetical protein LBK99_07490, partial [Opitutaceae bacterium]|nr:hypothetical protein [Opitutaceae bacterium]